MNKAERIKMVKAMEFIARQINDEDVFFSWLTFGVPDGDIEYGDLDAVMEDDYFLADDNFADLMEEFLYVMSKAKASGGLYCDGVVDKARR